MQAPTLKILQHILDKFKSSKNTFAIHNTIQLRDYTAKQHCFVYLDIVS